MLRHGFALVALAAALGVGMDVHPASANHAGATVDCGSAGTFTIRARQTPAMGGLQAPLPVNVLRFEEGGVLTVFRFVEDGRVLVDVAGTGQARNRGDEVTCTFRLDGRAIEVTGILTP